MLIVFRLMPGGYGRVNRAGTGGRAGTEVRAGTGGRAGTGACPYGGIRILLDFYDSVDMVRHDNKPINTKSVIMGWDSMPYGFYHFTRII
ncbi:MAG: hypothetical protein HN366_28470 [Deltaproteobacteria bacterium]|nr:hypothetical protein [Deltaproteobacteria bacterium]